MTQNNPHPSGLDDVVVLEKVLPRRGRLHAFPTLNPVKTALVVIDLDSDSVGNGETEEIRPLIAPINQLAKALRSKGGTVAWVTTPMTKASKNFKALYGDEAVARYEKAGQANGGARTIWHELNVQDADIRATKGGASAFFPGKADLHEQLMAKGITSVLVVGLVTNVCCESSARDAAELEYEVTLVSDCMWGHKQGQHEATLNTFYRNFGDVRPVSDVIKLIGHKS